MAELETLLIRSKADLALIGVPPLFPSEKYGYMVPKRMDKEDYLNICYFKEKPTTEEAARLVSEHAYWNCGVFAFKLGFLVRMMQEMELPTNYHELLHVYKDLEKISFDYAVLEKAKQIVALPYNGPWKDLGTWNTLTEEMGSRQIGHCYVSNDCHNTHVVNELNIPVAVIGLENTVVAVSPDGILVTEKDSSPTIKEVLKHHTLRPMYEERRWGWYKVLDHARQVNGHEVLTKRISIKPGYNLSYQKHFARSEVWTIIKGEGLFAFEGTIRLVQSGDVLVIPLGTKHAIKAISELEIIEVQSGTQLVEEDIIRLYMSWEEIEEICGNHEDGYTDSTMRIVSV